MSRRSVTSEPEAKPGDGTPPGAASEAASGGRDSSASPASRIRLVVVEAEGDLASVMTAIDAIAEALNSPSKDARSSERPVGRAR
jgi:hypothetical protein